MCVFVHMVLLWEIFFHPHVIYITALCLKEERGQGGHFQDRHTTHHNDSGQSHCVCALRRKVFMLAYQ